MSILNGFRGTRVSEAGPIRGLAEPIPTDPNDPVVDHIYGAYPFGSEGVGLKSLIRVVVFTVLEMKKRGFI